MPADTRATYLSIPSLGIDAAVSGSQTVLDRSPAPPGCPPKPAGQETLTVPTDGIATPEEAFEGLENKVWIFGHSRSEGQPGLFLALEDIELGDEVFISGFERTTGDEVTDERFVVEGIYLADKDSGARLVIAETDAEIPPEPVVILQTSVRESGANARWIMDREQLLAKASNLIEGDIDDPCKYLLLFVIARSA